MPVDVLRCRVCESDYPALANGICVRCFGPLEPVYDWDELAPGSPASASRPARTRSGATPTCFPPRRRRTRRERPRLHAARPRAAARERARRRRGAAQARLANPTHSFKDRVVAVAAAKAHEFGLETLSCTSTGNLANAVAARAAAYGMPAVIFCPAGLEPEKMLATTVYGARVYGVRGSYDDCSRLISELAGEVDWGIVNVNLRSYYAEGSKTLAFEIVEQLGWESPTAVVCPIASGALFSKLWQGFEQFGRLGLIGERAAAALRRPGRGLRPGRDRVRRGAAGLAGAAELDRPLARDRQPRRRRSRDRDRARLGRRDPRGARGRGRPEHGAARRDVRRLRRDRRRRHARCAPGGGRARRDRRGRPGGAARHRAPA